MAKKVNFFLPQNLSPQSWLTDMLLGQIYEPENDGFRELIYGDRKDHKVSESFKHAHGKLIFFHPKHKNKFEGGLPLVTPDSWLSATANYVAGAVVQAGQFGLVTNPRLRYIEFLMNMTPPQQAALIPYIRFFTKTRRPTNEGTKNKNPWQEKPIVFKEFVDEEFILNNKFARIGSAGIKSLKVERKFPAWGKSHSFFFNADFYFSSMKAFTEGHPTDFVRALNRKDYLKLIIPQGQKTKCDGLKRIEDLEENLYVEYGWRFKKDTPDELIPFDIRQVFQKEERKVFKIRWTKHDFKFGENGEINLSVSYQGSPEFDAHADKEKNDILEIADFTKVSSAALGKATLAAAMEELKALKLESEFVDNFFSDCAGVQKVRRESLSAEMRELEDATIEELKREKRQKGIDLNKKINAVKKATALALQNVLLEIIAHERQLFKISFRSLPEGLSTVKPSFALQTEVTALRSKKRIESSLKKLKMPVAGLSRKDRQKFFDKSNVSAIKYSEFELSEVVKEFESVLKRKNTAGRYILNLLTGNDPENSKIDFKEELKTRVHALLCALTNCGHAAEAGGLEQRHRSFGNFLFFPLRALISAVYEVAGWKRRYQPSVALGNIIIRSLDEELWVNLGDILIEVSVFKEWFYKHVESVDRGQWAFGDFMNSVIYDLVPRALMGSKTNFGSIVREPYQVTEKWAKSKKGKAEGLFGDLAADPTSATAAVAAGKAMADLAVEVKKEQSDQATSLLYYRQFATPTGGDTEAVTPMLQSMGERNFNRWKDHRDGMYHLVVGEDRGILKTIDFSYLDNSGLRTALWLDTLVDSAAKFLKQPYQASPTMIGNNLYDKGAYFVISHNPLGISDVDDPGIRGYYRIDSLTDVISMGEYTTSVHGVNMGHNFDKSKSAKQEEILKGKKAKFGISAKHDIIKYITQNLIYGDQRMAELYFSSAREFKKELGALREYDCSGLGGTWDKKNKQCKCPSGQDFHPALAVCSPVGDVNAYKAESANNRGTADEQFDRLQNPKKWAMKDATKKVEADEAAAEFAAKVDKKTAAAMKEEQEYYDKLSPAEKKASDAAAAKREADTKKTFQKKLKKHQKQLARQAKAKAKAAAKAEKKAKKAAALKKKKAK